MLYFLGGGGIAQRSEQSAHNRLVAGSNPAAPTKRYLNRQKADFFSSKILLITFEVLVCYFAPILHEKCALEAHFYPINSSVITLSNLV